MNREVEERIVAMYFDNEDFEKNAKQTIETLGQLKDGLNLEESSKGFKVFDKIKSALNMDKANQGARKLRSTLTSLSDSMGKAANIGMAPVRALDNLFGTFRSYVSRFIGFDLAGKVVSTVEQTMRALTIAPVSAGWTQYQNKMDSVKTIMSGTGESIEVVEQHLQNLTEYANKTIYSLSDMTSNLGKFTNNGVKLEDATAAMQGIANATADAGQGATQASMAMYNISQAIGVGKMTTIDWKSLENANIATQRLKNTFLEVAAAGGRLEKETDGEGLMHFYLSKDENGNALKERIELTAANFREYLQKGWLDKDTLVKTFKLYSGTGITVDTLKAWGIDDEEDQKRLMQIGKDALEAAQQVRTFTKMMDALKESVQSGWADSFQYIFGNMEEGTTLWTNLNDRLDKVLSGQAEHRNQLLKQWSEMGEDYESVYKDKHGPNGELIKGAESGRDILVNSFFEMIDVVMEFGRVVGNTFHQVFGTMDAEKLMDITLGFRTLVQNFKAWLGSADDADSRLSKISKGLGGVFNIVKIGLNVLKSGFNLLRRLAAPVFDVVLDVFATVGNFLTGTGDLNFGQLFEKLGEGFTKLWTKIKSAFSPKDIGNGKQEMPIVTWLKNAWTRFKQVVREWANENGLGGVLDGFVSFKNAVVGWDGWTKISKFFTDAKDTVVGAWDEVKTWKIWEEIGSFFTDIWGWLQKTFKFGEGQEEQTVSPESQTSPIIKWIGGVWESIRGFWNNTILGEDGMKIWNSIGAFFSDTWHWIAETAGTTVAFFTQPDEQTGEPGIVTWIRGVWESITGFWNNTFMPAAKPVFESITGFLTDTWNWILYQFGAGSTQGMYIKQHTVTQTEAPVVVWLNGIWESIKGVWNDVVAWEGWGAIGEFLSNTWGWITGLFSGNAAATQGADEKSVKMAEENAKVLEDATAKNGFLSTLLTSVADFFTRVLDAVEGVVIPPEVSSFLVNVGDFLKGVIGAFSNVIGAAGRVLNGRGSLADVGTLILAAIIPLGVFITKILTLKWTSEIGEFQSFGLQFMEFAGGILMIGAAISLLTALDEQKVKSAALILGAFAVGIGVIVGVLMNLVNKRPQNEDAAVTGLERFGTRLIQMVEKLGLVFIALKMLPGVIESIGKAKKESGGGDIGKDLLDAMLGVSALITTVSVITTLVQKMTGNQGLDPIAALKTAAAIGGVFLVMSAVMLAVGGIGEAVDGIFGDGSHEAVLGAMEKAADFFRSFGKAISSFIGGLVEGILGKKTEAEKADDAFSIMEKLKNATSLFSSEEISGLTRMMTLISRFSDGTFAPDTSKMGDFAEAMGQLGEGVVSIATTLSDSEGVLAAIHDPENVITQRLTAFIDFGKRLADMLSTLGADGWRMSNVTQRISELAGAETIRKFVNNLQVIMNNLGDLKEPKGGIQFDSLNIVKKLFDSIQQGLIDPQLPAFDATPVVDAIVEALELGNEAIALAVHSMVQTGLNETATPGQNKKLTLPELPGMFKGMDWLNFKDAEGNKIDIVGQLQTHLNKLSEQLNGMDPLKVTITPVFDMANLTPESLQASLDAMPVQFSAGADVSKMTIEFRGLSDELGMNSLRDKLEQIRQAIAIWGLNNVTSTNRLGVNIDGVSREIGNMRLVLDTGALVGYILPMIDTGLYKRSVTASRTGTVTVLPQ